MIGMTRLSPFSAKGYFAIPRNLLVGLFLMWLLALCLSLFGLGNLPLRDFDEATVARVSFELSNQKGLDQLLPTLWGANYLNKPPGLHWLIALAIKFSRNFQGLIQTPPSEFVVRLIPALMSTLVVPLGGLIQWKLRPQDFLSSFATSGILLTLLPLARHGRLAMLDGTQLSAMALMWLLFLSIDQSKLDKFCAFFAGLVASFLLLLKAPFLIPAFLAGFLPLYFDKTISKVSLRPLSMFFGLGLCPGICWHIWHFLQRGPDALWLWGGDGATRVLFSAGEGSDLGFLVPIIEIFEGGWPWLILWPFGIIWAFHERHTRWGRWSLVSQFTLAFSILPLRTQLPWYSYPLWLPFSLICAVPFSFLINLRSAKYVSAKFLLRRTPYVFLTLGSTLLLLGVLGELGLIRSLNLYSQISICAGTGWLIGGWLLTRSQILQRFYGAISLIAGSFVALLLLMGSSFWLWELNESWPVKPVAQMISMAKASPVFIEDNHERPSLNWYAGQKILEVEDVSKPGWILVKKQYALTKFDSKIKCNSIQTAGEWSLIRCQRR